MTAEPCPGGGELIRITTLSSPGPQSPSSRSQHYDPEYAKIEAWLDEHRDFAYDYFLRYTIDYYFLIDTYFNTVDYGYYTITYIVLHITISCCTLFYVLHRSDWRLIIND